jgi:hypothetical protein
MTLKNASFLALIGTSLPALYAIWSLFSSLAGLARAVLPAVVLFSTLIHAFCYITLALFFWTYYNTQK